MLTHAIVKQSTGAEKTIKFCDVLTLNIAVNKGTLLVIAGCDLQ
jgi:hypothetical protein